MSSLSFFRTPPLTRSKTLPAAWSLRTQPTFPSTSTTRNSSGFSPGRARPPAGNHSSTPSRESPTTGRSKTSTSPISSATATTSLCSAPSRTARFRSARCFARRSRFWQKYATGRSSTSSSWKTRLRPPGRSAPREHGPSRPIRTALSTKPDRRSRAICRRGTTCIETCRKGHSLWEPSMTSTSSKTEPASTNRDVARHWIDGAWVDSGEHRDSVNPATGEVFATYAMGGTTEAEQAIDAAKRAFAAPGWRSDRALRARVLNRMADRFEDYADELVDILALENGKTKPQARFEVQVAPETLRFNAALALADAGRASQVTDGDLLAVGDLAGAA